VKICLTVDDSAVSLFEQVKAMYELHLVSTKSALDYEFGLTYRSELNKLIEIWELQSSVEYYKAIVSYCGYVLKGGK
jgi:hypothetical protein